MPAPLHELTVGDLKKSLAAVTNDTITVKEIKVKLRDLNDGLPLRAVLAMLPALTAKR